MSVEMQNEIIADVFKNKKELLTPEFCRILAQIRQEHAFAAPGIRYGFWANNLRPELKDNQPVLNEKGEQQYRHHGNANLQEFGDPGTGYNDHTPEEYKYTPIQALRGLEDQIGFRKGQGILSLGDIENRTDLSQEQKQAICALQSFAYAEAAEGPVVTSVQGANPKSFFRTTEIFSIMNNPNITGIQILSEDMDKVNKNGIGKITLSKVLDKKEGYHTLRDEWVESAIKQYQKIENSLNNSSPEKQHSLKAAMDSAREILAREQALAEHMQNETHPFSKNGFYDKDKAPQYDDNDRARERKRCQNIEAILVGKKDIEKTHTLEQKNAFKRDLDAKKMDSIDKVLYTSLRHVLPNMDPHQAKDPEKIGMCIKSLTTYKPQTVEHLKANIKSMNTRTVLSKSVEEPTPRYTTSRDHDLKKPSFGRGWTS